MFRSYLSPLLFMLGIIFSKPVYADSFISAELNQAIIHNYGGTEFEDFKGFLTTVYLDDEAGLADTKVKENIAKYLADATMSQEDKQSIHRLLGAYTRIKYGAAAMETLSMLVAIPTFRTSGVEQHENPSFIKFANTLEAIAEDFGLPFRNIDGRVYEIFLAGSGDELVGLHAHADVVPANAEHWVLDNGTQLDPFKLTRIGNRMYARGAEDDKNGIVVTLYAMKVIKDERLDLLRNFKLLIDTTEETSSTAIPYYFERNPMPSYNLALDGSYPVVIAEKGYGVVMADFPIRTSSNKGLIEFISLTGGLATNQIPSVSIAEIVTDEVSILLPKLSRLAAKFVADNGNDFTISATESERGISLVVKGVSAHSSSPGSGVNPVSRMLLFIDSLNDEIQIKKNHITDAALYARENWGLDFHGKQLGIEFSDAFMGPMTAAFTFVELNTEALKVAVNLRVPVGKEPKLLTEEIESKLGLWQKVSGVDFGLDVMISVPMYRNPKGKWVNTLLDVAAQNLGLPPEFVSSSGGTSVHNLPNGVQFGLSMPGQKYTGHNANEFKTVDQFLLDLQIVTEMIARIGQMPDIK